MKIEIRVAIHFCWYLIKFRSISRAKDATRQWLRAVIHKLQEELVQLDKDAKAWEAKNLILEAEIITGEANLKSKEQELAALNLLIAGLKFLRTLEDEEPLEDK